MGTVLDEKQRHVIPIVVVGLLMTAAYALIGALQILVWNPMSAVPDMNREEIKAAMSAANEPLVEGPVYVWALAGLVLAAIVGVLAVVKWSDSPWMITRLFLIIIMLGMPTYFLASVNPGMSIADAFATSGGDHAPWSMILYGTSLLSSIFFVVTLTKQDEPPRRATSPYFDASIQ